MDTDMVKVRQKGRLTIPANIRARRNIKPGDTLRIVDLDGVLVLTPVALMIPELAHEIECARIETGLSTEGLLDNLQAQRERYVRENYKQTTSE